MSRSRTEPPYNLRYQAYLFCQHEQTAKLFEDVDDPLGLDAGWTCEKVCTYGTASWALLESDEPFDVGALDLLAERVATLDAAFTAIKKAVV